MKGLERGSSRFRIVVGLVVTRISFWSSWLCEDPSHSLALANQALRPEPGCLLQGRQVSNPGRGLVHAPDGPLTWWLVHLNSFGVELPVHRPWSATFGSSWRAASKFSRQPTKTRPPPTGPLGRHRVLKPQHACMRRHASHIQTKPPKHEVLRQ